MERLKINDTYEIIVNFTGDKDTQFKCLRYGEEWRDLIGDNMILAMFYRIQELEEALNYYSNCDNYYKSEPTTMIPVLWDKGYIARQALKIID